MDTTRAILIALILTVFSAGSLSAQTAEPSDKALPLEITSRTLEADGGLRKVVFLGNVVAVQGEMTLRSQKLIVNYLENGQQISSVEALGDVKVEKGGRIATAGRGLYEVEKGTVTLTDGPRVQQDDNTVEGDEIVFFLDEDRSIVKSQTGSRVRAVLTPREKTVEP
jgi:lipopolysaccharide export system protein LptA